MVVVRVARTPPSPEGGGCAKPALLLQHFTNGHFVCKWQIDVDPQSATRDGIVVGRGFPKCDTSGLDVSQDAVSFLRWPS